MFSCVYATKGFKAQEHVYCFIDSDNPSEPPHLEVMAKAMRQYSARYQDLGLMTSLVVLTPQPSQPRSIDAYRKIYWNALRGLADLDECPWPSNILEPVDSPRWCFCFHGQRYVSLAMTPNYTLRRSRYNPCFCMAFQPMPVFKKLLSTPEKLKTALDRVRTLTDAFDDVEYSPMCETSGTRRDV